MPKAASFVPSTAPCFQSVSLAAQNIDLNANALCAVAAYQAANLGVSDDYTNQSVDVMTGSLERLSQIPARTLAHLQTKAACVRSVFPDLSEETLDPSFAEIIGSILNDIQSLTQRSH